MEKTLHIIENPLATKIQLNANQYKDAYDDFVNKLVCLTNTREELVKKFLKDIVLSHEES